jgi:hypothetical protein
VNNYNNKLIKQANKASKTTLAQQELLTIQVKKTKASKVQKYLFLV